MPNHVLPAAISTARTLAPTDEIWVALPPPLPAQVRATGAPARWIGAAAAGALAWLMLRR